MSSDTKDFYGILLLIVFFCGSIISMIIIPNIYSFLLSLLIVNICAILEIIEKNRESLNKFTNSLYLLWVVTGIFVTLGNTYYIPYAKPATEIAHIHYLLDVRYLITIFLFLTLLIKAIWKAIQQGRPDIPSFPDLTLPDIPREQISIIATVFRPFVIVINAFLKTFQTILDILWKLAALVLTYLGRFGKNLANQFFDIITSGNIWISIFRVLLTFFLVVAFTYATILTSPHIILYLTSTTSFASLSTYPQVALALKWMIGFFLLSLFAIIIICLLWEVDEFMLKTVFSGSIILVACSLAGAIMYLTARIQYMNVIGFDSLGVFSLVILIVVASVFVFQLIRRITA